MTPPPYVAPKGCRNGCAQAALAWLLHHRTGAPQDVRALYRRHPPDTPLALLGTTPWRLEAMMRAEGLDARRWWGDREAGGARLRKALGAGLPVVLLVDNARLGGRAGYHYVVATGCDEEGVSVTNAVPGGARRVAWRSLRRAWGSWAPGPYRWCGIEAVSDAAATGPPTTRGGAGPATRGSA